MVYQRGLTARLSCSYRFPQTFVDTDQAFIVKYQYEEAINTTLSEIRGSRKKRSKNTDTDIQEEELIEAEVTQETPNARSRRKLPL